MFCKKSLGGCFDLGRILGSTRSTDCRRWDWTFPCRCGCEGGWRGDGGEEKGGRRKDKEEKENSSYKQKDRMDDRISGLLYQSVAKE